MIQAAVIIVAGVGIGVVFAALILGVARNPSFRGQLFSYAILGLAFAEATGLFALMMAFWLFCNADFDLIQFFDISLPYWLDSFMFIEPSIEPSIEPDTLIIHTSTDPSGSLDSPLENEVWVVTDTGTTITIVEQD